MSPLPSRFPRARVCVSRGDISRVRSTAPSRVWTDYLISHVKERDTFCDTITMIQNILLPELSPTSLILK